MPAAPPLEVDHAQWSALRSMARSRSSPDRCVRQARALLLAADGVANEEIARRVDATPATVRRWRARFAEEGVEWVGRIRAGRGRPTEIPAEVVDAIVADTLASVRDDGSAWSTRTLGERYGISKDSVARIWQSRGLRPWTREAFALVNDPNLGSKLVDVVGLYLNPPEAVAVFSFDDTAQPRRPGRRRVSVGADLKSRLDVGALHAAGAIEASPRVRHRIGGRELMAFFRSIDEQVDPDLQVNAIVENLPVSRSQPVRTWLFHRKRRRWHLHTTPTSSSWADLVASWIALADVDTDRRTEITSRLDRWSETWPVAREPFIWTPAS